MTIKKLLLKSLRQKDIPFRKRKILILAKDISSNAHLREILPVLTEKITVPGRRIDIMISIESNKGHAPEHLKKILGAPIVKHYKIIQKNIPDLPAALDDALLNYDFIILAGLIEPHKDMPFVFSVNTVNDEKGKALKIFYGPWKDVFEKSVNFSKEL